MPFYRVIILLLISVLLAACAKPADDVIRFGLTRLPVTLDPRFATDAASSRVNRLLYQRLVDFDENAIVVPSLATWEFKSPTLCRFHLTKNRNTFINGARLSASDVKATYDFILDRQNASPHNVSLANINAITVIDDNIIDFELKQPDILFPGRLLIGILPETLIKSGHAFNRSPVGSGSFEIVDWQGDTVLRLKRQSDQQLIEFVAVPDPTVRVLKLLRGEIDMLQNDLPPEMVRYLEQGNDVTVVRQAGSNFAYLGFNLTDVVTGQREIRTAIAYALNRQAIITYVLGNSARVANSILPPNHWAGHRNLVSYPYDPAHARAIMKSLGYSQDAPLHLTYKTSSDPFRLRLATIIQQQLAEVGINVALQSYDWGTFYGDIKNGNFQMYSLMWVGIKLPDIFRYAFHSESIPPNGANRGRLTDAFVDDLINAAEQAQTIAEQATGYRALQSYLLEQLPYVPLWYEDNVFVSRKSIAGYQIANDGNYDGLELVNSHSGGAGND